MSGGAGRRSDNDSPDLAPLALAAVGKRLRQTTPGWVLSLPLSSTTAAIAADGLARTWAGRGAGDGSDVGGGGGDGFRAAGDGGIAADGGGGIEGAHGGSGGGGSGKGGSGANRQQELNFVCIDDTNRGSNGKLPERDAMTLPSQAGGSVVLSVATAAGGSPAVAEHRRVATATLRLALKHQQQRRRHRPRRNRFKKSQLSSFSAPSACGLSFARGGGGGGGNPSTGSNATGKACTDSPAVDVAVTEEGLAAAELSMTAAAVVAQSARERGLIRTVGRPKRGPCMFIRAASGEIGRRAGSTRTELPGYSGSGRGRGEKGFSPRPMWEAEATGGLLGPGETKVLVC